MIVVIFLFLGSFRSVLIPIVAIPVSLVGAVFLMLVAGFTINLLTLLAIVLSVGLVVDDAIVMVENVERHLHEGKRPVQAAIDAARELVGPIIAMTITLAAVYTPVAIQGGLTGSLFREFALTLAGAVLVSGVVALTLSPMMGAKLLRAGDNERGFAGCVNRRFDSVRATYRRALAATLRYRPVVLTVWIARDAADRAVLPVLAAGAGALRGPGVLLRHRPVVGELDARPDEAVHRPDPRRLPLVPGDRQHLPDHVSERRLRRHDDEAVEPADQDDAAAADGVHGAAVADRRESASSRRRRRRCRAAATSRSTWSSRRPPNRSSCSDIANALVQKAFASGLFIFADADLKFDQPQTEIVFDRDKLRSQGVDLSQAGPRPVDAARRNYVNRFSIQGRSYKVIPQVERVERLTPDQLSQIYVTGSRDKLVPLSTFASLKATADPRELRKFQQLNAVRIQGVIPPPVPLDQALSFLEKEARTMLPQGFSIDYAGESRQLRTEGSRFLGTFLLSAVLIYLVLAAQFESFRDPFIILVGSVPLAVSGALLFSFLGPTTLNIYSQVGLITLVGLVSKNGILIVQFAKNCSRRGADKLAAVIEAAPRGCGRS